MCLVTSGEHKLGPLQTTDMHLDEQHDELFMERSRYKNAASKIMSLVLHEIPSFLCMELCS